MGREGGWEVLISKPEQDRVLGFTDRSLKDGSRNSPSLRTVDCSPDTRSNSIEHSLSAGPKYEMKPSSLTSDAVDISTTLSEMHITDRQLTQNMIM